MELAREEVRGNPSASLTAREFAAISLGHAESGCHKLFRQYGFSAPVEISYIDLDPPTLTKFPIIMFSDWAKLLLNTGRFCRLMCGVGTFSQMREVLTEFWGRYKVLYPRHEIYTMDGVDLSMTVPVYSHTDEGRSYKHQPLWVLSTHGCVGRGTRAYIARKQHLLPVHQRPMGLNFTGSTWSTQFMSAAVLRATLTETPGSMDKIVEAYALDMSKLANEGLDGPEGHIRVVHLGTKGFKSELAISSYDGWIFRMIQI